MSRAVIAVDRLAAILAGLALLAAGLAGLIWWRGNMGLSGALNLAPVVRQATQPWWPWAVSVVGLLLVVLGIRWLVAHLPTPGVAKVRLPGTGAQGRLSADVKSLAQVAAGVLQTTPGVRSARGTIQRDRGQIIARLTATIEPHADLQVIAAAAEAVSADLKTVLQRDDLHCLVNLRVARKGRQLPRVA